MKDGKSHLEVAKSFADFRRKKRRVSKPPPIFTIPRKCTSCDVTWKGKAKDDCWLCGEEGINGPSELIRIPYVGNIENIE